MYIACSTLTSDGPKCEERTLSNNVQYSVYRQDSGQTTRLLCIYLRLLSVTVPQYDYDATQDPAQLLCAVLCCVLSED